MSDYGQGDRYGGQYGDQYGEPYAPEYDYGYSRTEPLPEPPPASNKKILSILGGLIIVCVVVLILALVGVFDTGSTSSNPRQVATKFLEAGKNQDLEGARAVLCTMDLNGGTAGVLLSAAIQTYSVDAVSQGDSTATVTATIRNGSRSAVLPIPLTKEDGKWKVCLPSGANIRLGGSTVPSSGGQSTPPGSTSVPPVSSPVPSVSIPTDIGGLTNVCQSATSAQMAAQVFVGALALGSTELAQGCVFNNAVPAATIAAIASSDTLYSQISTSGSMFVFQSTDGSKKLTVTITKESDGKFYVTALTQG